MRTQKRRMTSLGKLTVLLIAAAFLLAACGGKKAVFNVTQNDDNTISITAESSPKDSSGLSYITLGEGEKVIVEPDLDVADTSAIELRFFKGVLGEEDTDFGEEPGQVVSISGKERTEIALEPGEYTVGVRVLTEINGSVTIRTE